MGLSQDIPDSEPTSLSLELQQNQHFLLRVHDIIITGNTRTKDYLIERHLQPLRAVQTVGELLTAVEEARDGLERLGLFATVQLEADSGPVELPDTANIHIVVEELKDGRSGSFGTFQQGQERTLEGSGKLRNSLGRGEDMDIKLAYGSASSTTFEGSYNQPHIQNSEFELQSGVSLGCTSYAHHSSHTQSHKSCSVSVRHPRGHEFGCEFGLRTNTVTPGASSAIHKLAGHSLLLAGNYGYKYQHPDWDPLRPRRGYVWAYNAKLAGGWRELVRFFKQDASFQHAVPLPFANAAITNTVSAGILFPKGTSHINDRFSLGGPHNMRGFRTSGVGPTDTRAPVAGSNPTGYKFGKDSIGGDAFLFLTSALSFDILPWLSRHGIHGHVFTCWGTLGESNGMNKLWSDPRGVAKDIFGSLRGSIGAGLVWPTSLGRLELNWARVLRKLDSDKVVGNKWGIQSGFGGPAP